MEEISPHQLLSIRKHANSVRGARTDPYHLALVIEGGGMRGVVGIAMALAFEERGLLPVFDSVHGSSAGACSGAYFAAGQAKLGVRIYYEDINNRNFIDKIRILWGGAILDKDFLIDHVMRNVKPLNADKVVEQKDFLHVVITDCRTGSGRVVKNFRDSNHLMNVLRASICMPIIAGTAVDIDGNLSVDGGMVQQIALQSAIDAGATHIVALLTRKIGELDRPDRMHSANPEVLLLRAVYGANLATAYKRRNRNINSVVRRIMAGKVNEDTMVDVIVRGANATEIDRLSIDRNILLAAAEEARAAALDYVNQRK